MNTKRWALLAAVCLLVAAMAVFYPSLVDMVMAREELRKNSEASAAAVVPVTPAEKLSDLEYNHTQYDSYLIGGPAAEAISLERLNGYLEASFCGLTGFEADLDAMKQAADQLLEKYTVQYLVLVLDPTVAAEIPADPAASIALSQIRERMSLLTEIKAHCEVVGAELLVIWQPLSATELNRYDWSSVEHLLSAAAAVTDCWSFLDYGAVQCDGAYFSGTGGYSAEVGDLMLARIFSDETVTVPEDFGSLLSARQEETDEEEKPSFIAHVPILMYHAFVTSPEQVTGATMVSDDTFESHLQALEKAGYETVSFSDLIAFVYEGTPLPEKPVVLIADDGYLSNLNVAAPLLARYDATMSVAVIGFSMGEDTYKETGVSIYPHFSVEQARPWVNAGVIEIVSHTYDMHRVANLEGGYCRQGVYPLYGESEEAYTQALTEDFSRSKQQLEEGFGVAVEALAYPHGYFTERSEQVAKDLGFKVTMTILPGSNKLVQGMPRSLQQMHRNWITDDMTGEDIIELLKSFE